MKKIINTILLTAATLPGLAQGEAVAEQANQDAKMVLSNAIDITFVSTGSEDGGNVSLPFNSVNDYANGIESETFVIKVRSNKKFRVQAKASSSDFSYTGNTIPTPKMKVKNVLFLKVSDNNTGGKVANGFNNKYRSMSKSTQTLISNGTPGGDNTFMVQYKAQPGFDFPAGTYAVNIIYTATQS